MGKIRSKESSRSVNGSRRSRSKIIDSSGTTVISSTIRKKFAWVLQKELRVEIEELHHSKLPTVFNASTARTQEIRSNESSPDIRRLLHKKSRERTKFAASKCNDHSTASHSRTNDNALVCESLTTTEEELSEEEMRKILKRSTYRGSKRTKPKPKICTRDPGRVTPCYDDCCMEDSKAEKPRKNISKNNARKRTKDQKSRTKIKELSREQVSQKQIEHVGKTTPTLTTKLKIECNSTNPLCSLIRSPEIYKIPTVSKCNERAGSSKVEDIINKTSRINISDNDIRSSSCAPSTSINFNFQRPSNSQPLEEKSSLLSALLSKPKAPSFETFNLECTHLLKRRTRPLEYFSDLNARVTCLSETNTSHPKASLNRQNQNQMLEGEIFPNARNEIHSNNQSSLQKFKHHYGSNSFQHISPLNYQENEMYNGNHRLNNNTISNGTGNQNFSNPENAIDFTKNLVGPGLFNTQEIPNNAEYSEKDRFRQSSRETVRGNISNLVDNSPNIPVNEFKGDLEITTGIGSFFREEGSPLGNQMPYPVYNIRQEEPAVPLNIIGENSFSTFHNEFSNESNKMVEINTHVEEHIIPNILSQKEQPKIRTNEAVPPHRIQILPRLSHQEKVPIMKINNPEQLRKDDFQQGQKSLPCDCNVNDENSPILGLTATQASDMLNSNMVSDLDNVLENGLDLLSYDDFLRDDIVNNNEKMLSQSDGYYNISELANIKDKNNEKGVTQNSGDLCISGNSTECTEGPLSQIKKLFNENPYPCRKPKSSLNKFTPVNNYLSDSEETPYNVSISEELDSVAGTRDVNEDFPNFKEPDWNSPNSANEEVNHYNFSSNHRKRKWLDEKEKSAAQSGEKKVKLKRTKWSHEGDTDNSSVSSSYKSSIYDTDRANSSMFDDNHNGYQINKEITSSKDYVVNNESHPLRFTNLLANGEHNTNINEQKVKPLVQTKVEGKVVETRIQPRFEANVRPNFEAKVQSTCETKVQLSSETKVQPTSETEVQSRSETEVQPSSEEKTQLRYESKVESKFQVFKEACPIKESLVDPEPEPEREDSDNHPPQRIQKATNFPIRHKKRRSGHRSKFSPNYYSNSSSDSSEDELIKKDSSSSGDEIQNMDNFLKQRFEQKLTNLQEISENSNSHVVDMPITYEDKQDVQDVQDVQDGEEYILDVNTSPTLSMSLSMSSRCPSPTQIPKSYQNSDFSDTQDNYLDTFQRKNKEECMRDLRSQIDQKKSDKLEVNNQPGSSSMPDNSEDLFRKPFTVRKVENNQNEPPVNPNIRPTIVSRPPVSKVFFGVCHCFLKNGNCIKKKCIYEHQIPNRLQDFKYQNEQDVFNIIHNGISAKFSNFMNKVYKVALKKLNYEMCLQIFTEACNAGLMNEQLLYDTLEVLWQKQGPIGKAIAQLAQQPLDEDIAPLWLLKLLNIAVNWIPKNEYWETVRPLITKVRFPSPFILEQILLQCIHDQGNEYRIEEVYNYFYQGHYHLKVRGETWLYFCKIREEMAERRRATLPQNLFEEFYNNENHVMNQGIASPDHRTDHQSPTYPNAEYNIPASPEDMEICNTPDIDTNYKLQPIDELPPPKSANRERDNVWKFFDHLDSLKKGLKHKDYEHVVSILRQYVNAERTLFIRHCHRMLATEVNKSQEHVNKTIKTAVQTGDLYELREILYRLGTCVLIDLADQGLWVHAYELLKTLQTYSLHKKDAGFILLAAEICLANHRSLKALTLLKQSDIIFTNCKKWKVASNQEDIHLRTTTVTLLLESLCQEFAEKAFFIFDIILGEQPSNSEPVDLTRVVDKLMLSLIAQNHVDLVMNLCKKAMRYHLNFHETTFRSVIKTLVPNDLVLARQFYQYATQLGVYSPVKVYPVTNVIINVDWSEEEMYIVVLEFLRKLFLNIGFAASHLRPNQLGVFFVFETVPERKQLYHEHSDSKRDKCQRVNRSKSMMKELLQNRFDPPIHFVKKEQGRICKLKSRSLVDYLKAGHVTA